MERLDRLHRSLADDLAWLGELPTDLNDFQTMAAHRQSAARAALKSFEQIEDQLARGFRTISRLLGVDSARWFARDHADFMEQIGVLDSAASWTPIVKLRNLLVHDYPLDESVQFERFSEAMGHVPMLNETRRRLAAYVSATLPGKLP